mmetsp:Transcript_6693/g.13756  ORF Transcript_6693/g.13756 Transcript_6693/m.13756 type:complete len:539 (-) Transcript_6693:357-1973(-)
MPKANNDDAWLESALHREADRGDNFKGIEGIVRRSVWFNPRWRSVLIKWYKEVGRVYTMSPATVENAVFFLDAFLAATMESGKELAVADFQLIGMVAILVSAKMYGAGVQLKVADLIQLAPQLSIQARDLCVMELTLIQTLQFNLFVPTTVEFASAIVRRLKRECVGNLHTSSQGGGCMDVSDVNFEAMDGFALRFAILFEKDLGNIEYRQSEKALAAATFALARWSVGHLVFASGVDEASALRRVVATVWAPRPRSLDALSVVQDQVQRVWREMVEGVSELADIEPARLRILQRRLLKYVHTAEASSPDYPSTPIKASTVRSPEPIAEIEAVPVRILAASKESQIFGGGAGDIKIIRSIPRRPTASSSSSSSSAKSFFRAGLDDDDDDLESCLMRGHGVHSTSAKAPSAPAPAATAFSVVVKTKPAISVEGGSTDDFGGQFDIPGLCKSASSGFVAAVKQPPGMDQKQFPPIVDKGDHVDNPVTPVDVAGVDSCIVSLKKAVDREHFGSSVDSSKRFLGIAPDIGGGKRSRRVLPTN